MMREDAGKPHPWKEGEDGTWQREQEGADPKASADPGNWDPLLQSWHLDKRLLEQQNRKYKGLKVTARICSWGKL